MMEAIAFGFNFALGVVILCVVASLVGLVVAVIVLFISELVSAIKRVRRRRDE